MWDKELNVTMLMGVAQPFFSRQSRCRPNQDFRWFLYIPYFHILFPTLNSFLLWIVSSAKIEFIEKVKDFNIAATIWINWLQFPNSKKNSFRGNCMRKYGSFGTIHTFRVALSCNFKKLKLHVYKKNTSFINSKCYLNSYDKYVKEIQEL